MYKKLHAHTNNSEKSSDIRGEKHEHWIALNVWIDQIGISSITAWRWRKKGWLKTINVGGRLFVTPDELRVFESRANTGEFKKGQRVIN